MLVNDFISGRLPVFWNAKDSNASSIGINGPLFGQIRDCLIPSILPSPPEIVADCIVHVMILLSRPALYLSLVQR